MWNCDRGNILSRNIWLKLVAPENLVSSLGILLYREKKMAQIESDLENNHTGRKLPTLAIRLGFLIEIFSYNYLRKLFIGIPIQILIFLSAMLTLSLGRLWF